MVDTAKIVSRFKYEFLSNIFQAIVAGILVVFLSRMLDPDGYGLLYLALSVLGFTEVFCRLGIAKSTARYVSMEKERTPGKIADIIRSGVVINLFVLLVVCLLFLFLHPHISNWLDEPGLESLLFVGILYLIFQTSFLFVRRILQSTEKIQESATIGAIEHGLRLVFTVILVLLGYQAFGALVGYILALLVGSIFGMIYISEFLSEVGSQSDSTGKYTSDISSYAIPLTASSASNVLDKRVDTILIGFFLGATPVSFYIISKQIIQFVETPVGALGFTLAPTLEVEKASGNVREAANLYQQALSNVLLLYIPATAGIILVSEPLVTLIFGSDYQNAVPVLQIFALYILIQSTTKITSNALDYLGRAKIRAITKMITAALHVLISLVLIPTIGVEGAAMSAVITYGIYAVVCIFVMHSELKIDFIYVSKFILASTIGTVLMSVVVYSLLSYVSGILTLVGVIIIGAIIWSVLILTTGIIQLKHVLKMLSS